MSFNVNTKNNPNRGKCRDCALLQPVSPISWTRSSNPKCTACGGMLDKDKPIFKKKTKNNTFKQKISNKQKKRQSIIRKIHKNYQVYLESDLWQQIRLRVLIRDNYTCRLCGEHANQVHHSNYKPKTLIGRHIDALYAICQFCHKEVEFYPDGTKRTLKQMRKRMKELALQNLNIDLFPSIICDPDASKISG